MQALTEAIGGPRPPVNLVARCEGLVAWIDVDSELAMLLDQPVAETAGTRGAAPSDTTLEFALDDGTFVIELETAELVLHGQLLGGHAQQIMIRTAAGAIRALPVDELGNFVLIDPPSGTIRLELELGPHGRRIHTDWFVLSTRHD